MKHRFFSPLALMLFLMLCCTYLNVIAQTTCPRKIFFTSPSVGNPVTNIWIMDSTGGNRWALFNDSYYRQVLTVANDGSKLAYTKRKNPNSGTGGDSLWICTSNIDGTNEVQHYLLPSYATTEIRDLDFDTSNTKILFNTFEGNNRDGDLYVLNITNLSITQLTFNTDTCKGEAQYSPDNSTIAYTENGTNWYAYPFPGKMMNSNGTNITNFTPAGYGNYHQFNYAPDGTKLVFTYFASLGFPYTLYTVNPNGTGLQSLNYSASWQMQPVFNPYSNRIAIVDNNVMKLLDLSGTVLQTINPGQNTTFAYINWVAVSNPAYLINARADSASVCVNTTIHFYADTIPSATYSWTGPNGFTSVLQNPVITNSTLSQSGTYIVTATIPGCGSYTDTVTIAVTSCTVCAPSLQLSDTLNYCAPSACTPIASSLLLQDTCNTTFNGAKVYFNTGYINGQDILQWTNQYGITGSFNASTGVLTFTGAGTAAQYQTVLQSVCYKNNAANPTLGQREIYFVIGDLIYNPVNNHYYKLVNNGSAIGWTNARSAAAATTYFGMQGYLMTVTNQQENDFFAQLMQSDVWIGASDAAQEGVWRWVTGCEGLEDNGQGRHFSNQNKDGPCHGLPTSGINGNYANWNVGTGIYGSEPNDCNCPVPGSHCEDYAYLIYGSTGTTWNDFPDNGGVNSYVIEYGCMPGDPPNIQTTGAVVVNVVAKPTITVSPISAAVCSGGSITLTASGASNYTWSPSTGLSNTIHDTVTASPTATTVYTITGTDANGCVNTATKMVTVNPLPAPPTVTTPVPYCQNAMAAALAATGSNLLWYISATGGTGSITAPTPSTSTAGSTTYYVSQTVNGCESPRAAITVNVNALPTVSIAPATAAVCVGQSIALTASGGVSYTWSPSTGLSNTTHDTTTATPSATTAYTVTVTDGNGCVNTTARTVTVNPLPVISVSPATAAICMGLQGIALSASGAATYTWSPATGLSSTSGASITANPTATTVYTITGTDANGCMNTATKNVTVNPVPTVTAGSNSPVCAGISLNLTATSSIAGSSFQWTGTASFTSSQQNPTINNPTPTQSGNYTVTATANGCTSLPDTVSVTVYPLPPVNAGADVSICKLASAQLNATGAASYTWLPSAALSCTNCANPIASPLATTTYTVTGTDTNGCHNSDDVVVSLYAQPVISAGADKAVCDGKSIQLQATGGVSYLWSPASYLSCTQCDKPIASPPQDITYSVTGTDAHGCTDSAKTNIQVIHHQPVSFCADDSLCLGASITLSANGGDQYTWSPASGLSCTNCSNPVATPAITTTYMAIVQQSNCFADTGHITLSVFQQPTIDAGQDKTVIGSGNVVLLTQGANIGHYLWSPPDFLSCTDCAAPLATPPHTIVYTITVYNGPCIAQDEVTVFMGCDKNIFMPNTFTPNGDGLNDRLYPQRRSNMPIQRFRVFDRWGELLFERTDFAANDALNGWDGTYKGRAMLPGVYVYIVDALCDTGKEIQVKGDITLIR